MEDLNEKINDYALEDDVFDVFDEVWKILASRPLLMSR